MVEDAPAPGLLRRLAAILYDTFLVLPLIMLAAFLAMGLRQLLGTAEPEALSPWVVRAFALACCIGFFSAFWLKGGQTLGMQAWRIRLVTVSGEPLTLSRCALRCFCAALAAAPAGLGYLWCLVDREGRGLHDLLSGTRLVLLPKRRKDAPA